jgi:hypothetical protein
MCHAKIFQLDSKWCTSIELKVDGAGRIIDHVNASFAVHEESSSHTGGRTKYNWNSINQIKRKNKAKNYTGGE